MPFPNPDNQFKKGNPGGPGRPKKLSKLLSELAESLLPAENGIARTRAEAICGMAYQLALEGDLNAIKFIFERIEGKPAEAAPGQSDDDVFEQAIERILRRRESREAR
jgi:hypothetical protein